MQLPKLSGQMFVKKSLVGENIYCYSYCGRRIEKFYSLCDKEISSVIIPEVDKKYLDYEQTYVLSEDCFKNLKNETLTVVVTSFDNLQLDHHCFGDIKNVKLILPKNMAMFRIDRMFDNYFDYETEWWLQISDKDFKSETNIRDRRNSQKVDSFAKDDFSVFVDKERYYDKNTQTIRAYVKSRDINFDSKSFL